MNFATKPAFLILAAFLFWAATICLFTVVAPWTTAVEPTLIPEPVAREEALNLKWVAAVKDHGVWGEWKRGAVSQRPAFFAVHLLALLFCGVTTFLLAFRADRLRKAVSAKP